MATAAVVQSVVGIKGLVGVGGAQLAPPTARGLNGKLELSSVRAVSDCASTRASRALSGKFCSSSSHRGVGGSIGSFRSTRGDEFRAGWTSSPASSTVGLQLLDIGESLAWRSRGSAIKSVSEDQNIAESADESLPSALELESSSDDSVARPQPIVQGFGDSPFVGEFALDLSGGAVSGGGGSEFDSMTVSAMPMYRPRLIWFATSPEQENMIIDRAINATIVGSAGILALTKILTVDHDYWHGWTLVEILQYAPVHNWFAYEDLLKSHPVLAKMMISGTVYSLGDWIAQCYEGKPALEFNRTRMLRSGLVGFCLHGSMSHFYYEFCEWLFPFQGWWAVPVKVAFDQTLWSAFWNTTYFTVIGLLRLDSPAQLWSELRSTFVPLLTAGWKLWPLAHLVTYGLVPVEQRLLWVDMVEIVWVTILAMYSNEKSEARISEAETAAELKGDFLDSAVKTLCVDEVVADENLS